MKFIKDFKQTDEYLLVGFTTGIPQEKYMPMCYGDVDFVYTEDKIKKMKCNVIYVKWQDFIPEICDNGVVMKEFKQIQAPVKMATNPMELQEGPYNCYNYWDVDEMYKRIEEVACQ